MKQQAMNGAATSAPGWSARDGLSWSGCSACREALRYRIAGMDILPPHRCLRLGIGGFSALFVFLIVVFALIPGFGQTGPVARHPARTGAAPADSGQPAGNRGGQLPDHALLPPRPLPKMDFEDSGIPDAFRTLVVVPMMLVNEETIRAEVEKLEIRYLANKEANLLFSLFSDYTDSAHAFA